MNHVSLFKAIASKELPETLYQELEPHMEALAICYRNEVSFLDQAQEADAQYASRHYRETVYAFEKEQSKHWPAFAREHWPQIDKYYNLDAAIDKNDALPFNSIDHHGAKPAHELEFQPMCKAANEERSTEMSETTADAKGDQLTVDQWLQIRKDEGSRIDPETAEVMWNYAQVCDPYGVHPALPKEYYCVGREYFARAPGSDTWVCFGDLPDEIREKLWEKHRSKIAFPAGFEDFDLDMFAGP